MSRLRYQSETAWELGSRVELVGDESLVEFSLALLRSGQPHPSHDVRGNVLAEIPDEPISYRMRSALVAVTRIKLPEDLPVNG